MDETREGWLAARQQAWVDFGGEGEAPGTWWGGLGEKPLEKADILPDLSSSAAIKPKKRGRPPGSGKKKPPSVMSEDIVWVYENLRNDLEPPTDGAGELRSWAKSNMGQFLKMAVANDAKRVVKVEEKLDPKTVEVGSLVNRLIDDFELLRAQGKL